MARTQSPTRRRVSPAALGALVLALPLGIVGAVLVAPALADISPPTTSIPTSSGPSPDAAPTTTTPKSTTAPKKAPAPAPKPAPTTTAKKATAPPPAPVRTTPPVHTTPPTTQTPPQTTYSAPAKAKVVHRTTKKAVTPVHHAKAKTKVKAKKKAKAVQTTRKQAPPKPQAAVLGARATKRAAPENRVSSPAPSYSTSSSNAFRNALVILLFALPALALGASLVPPQAVPHRMAIAWKDVRLNVGLLAGSVLLVEALLYMLTR